MKMTQKKYLNFFDRRLLWIETQVAPTLKMFFALDDICGTTVMVDMIKNAKFTRKMKDI